jgi:diguanylate cyclase (GGDEF)-like protein
LNEFTFENALNQVSLGVVIYDSNLKFTYINKEEESDALIRNALIGKSDIEWCKIKSLSEDIAMIRKIQIKKSIESKQSLEYEEEFEYKGDKKYILRIISPSFDQEGNLINIIRQGRDITETKVAILKLEHSANHDLLTDLPNRRFLYFRMSDELSKPNRKDILLFLLDLDRFKTINDTLGHLIGDVLIKSVASRILNLFPATLDIVVSRLGGDEFVIACFHTDANIIQHVYAKKILECFAEPFLLGEHELFITTSIGVYAHLSKDTVADIDLILKHADIAMYKAKESGRNKFRIYSPGMDTKVTSKFTIETKLNQAVRSNEFLLYYQPRMNTLTRTVHSIEVLLRWNLNSEILETIKFFEAIEESGVLLILSKWIFKEAILADLDWLKLGLGKIPISINLSERQFYDDNLLVLIKDILLETGFPANLLELEISENSIMKNPEASEEILKNIHNLGIKITLDDFGSGYSSLGKLKDYPIDTINVSKALVHGVTENYQDAAIASAIVSMAHKLNIRVNAEGIETLEQLEFMRYLRCEYFQGFFFSKPVSKQEMEKYILSNVKQLAYSL